MPQLFRNIKFLVSMQGARIKQGRRVVAEDLSILKNACMLEDKGLIVAIGTEKHCLQKFKEISRGKAKTIDCENRAVIPGFVECHTHLVFAGSRSNEFEMRNQGATYQQIAEKGGGIISTVTATRKATPKQLQHIAEKHFQRFLKQGVTTVEVKSGYGLDSKSELKILESAQSKSGIEVVRTFLGPHAVPPEFKDRPSAYIDFLIEHVLPKVHKKNFACRADAFIEKGYFSIEDGQRYFLAAKKLGFDVVVHADQLNFTGATNLAIDMGARSADHVIEIDDSTIKRLAQSDTTAVLLPAADFYLRMKYPRARQIIDQGGRVAIATDFNPGTSPTQDLCFTGLLARLEMKMSLAEVFSAYTVGAAYALGLENQIGALQPGMAANFSLLDGEWDELFYQVGYHPISQSYIRGKKVTLSRS